MVGLTEDTAPITDACAYVIELYRELTEENGVLGVGAQNQAVNFILADPLLSRYAKQWARVPASTKRQPHRRSGFPVTRDSGASATSCCR